MATKKKGAPAKPAAKPSRAAVRQAVKAETAAGKKASKTNAQVRKDEAAKVIAAAGPPATEEERKRFVSGFVSELYARPDAQHRIIKDAFPTLKRLFGGDAPDAVDMNVREQGSAPAPGPMTRNVQVDPTEGAGVQKVGEPQGQDEPGAILSGAGKK